MLNVLITIDTETSPLAPDWRETRLDVDTARDIYGRTAQGDYGLPYQLEMFKAYGLKASFFVEALFAEAVGIESLAEIVRVIQDGGQEVQLHLHTEWLVKSGGRLLDGRIGINMRDFSAEDQTTLVARGKHNLKLAGARGVSGFRAGNYGANLDTLTALANNGLRFDTSYNLPYVGTQCGLVFQPALVQPFELKGVREFPVSWFYDSPGHPRHVQLCACSSGEITAALWNAWRQGWHSFVIVAHSFELLAGRKRRPIITPDRIVIRRFNRLCRFLADHRDKFRTVGFGDVLATDVSESGRPISSTLLRTAWRSAEQLARRVA
jgi:hypothetical protein